MNKINLGIHLKKLRHKAHITATQAAAAAGLSERMIYQYEAGRLAPRYETLMRLAEVYGVSIDTLMNPDASSVEPEESTKKG